ncbi:response regulator [Niastella caeni]|uniref:Response regulator n=1 Tax=Niastella caeni TaxID=2569763 RepID=A0A4S8HXM7_9BACT|nr:response regulator [Niastella caeni]THU40255.1 response regulator [Niastella caeni]
MVSPHKIPKKILLAEDDPDDRGFFFEFLEHRHDVLLLPPVENGEEVFEFLEKAKNGNFPDLIILDQNMPKCNGLQTLAILKNHSHYENIPVFVYSTYTDDYLKQRSIQLGARSVLEKPLSLEGYEKMIDAILELI